MRTERLYENDSHLRQFTAKVLSCEEVRQDGKYGWTGRRFTRKAAGSPGIWECLAAYR